MVKGQHETCPIMSMPWALACAMAFMSLNTASGLVLLCSNAATITGRPLFFDSDCKNDMDICPPLVTM